MNFSDLWDNYCQLLEDMNPCTNGLGEPNFENQCCIRFSTAMHRTGHDFIDYEGAKCWFGHKEPHCLRVEEMVEYLSDEFGKPLIRSNCTQDDFEGMIGIVVFIDFWARNEGDAKTGDHIDLFNGVETANGSPDYFERSRQVLFWCLEGVEIDK